MLADKLHQYGPQFSKALNFGPSEQEAITVAEIVTKMAEIWGSQPGWIQDLSKNPHEAHNLR
jgi:CDP-glucose 4,6-dehydratase